MVKWDRCGWKNIEGMTKGCWWNLKLDEADISKKRLANVRELDSEIMTRQVIENGTALIPCSDYIV